MELQVRLGSDGDLLQVFNRLYLIDINVMFGKHLLIELGMCLQVG